MQRLSELLQWIHKSPKVLQDFNKESWHKWDSNPQSLQYVQYVQILQPIKLSGHEFDCLS